MSVRVVHDELLHVCTAEVIAILRGIELHVADDTGVQGGCSDDFPSATEIDSGFGWIRADLLSRIATEQDSKRHE